MKRDDWYTSSWEGLKAGRRSERLRLVIMLAAAALYALAVLKGL